MKKAIIITFIYFTSHAMTSETLFSAPYGNERENVGYCYYDAPDECAGVPGSFNFADRVLIIDDNCNDRVMKYSQNSGKITQVKRKKALGLRFVDFVDSILIGDWYIYKINDSIVPIKKIVLKRYDSFSFIAKHPGGTTVIATNYGYRYYDKEYNEIETENVPDYIKDVGVVYFTDKKAMISNCFECLKINVQKHYYQLSDTPRKDSVPELFKFPARTEWGNYFKNERSSASMKFLGIDSAFNSYWSTGIHFPKDEKNSYSAVFSYTKLGELRYWFPEPKLKIGWKHYCGDIVVNRQGRIFQMVFYSLVNKEDIDKTKGIRIIEYIPEKDDFTHEGRVKKYGKETD